MRQGNAETVTRRWNGGACGLQDQPFSPQVEVVTSDHGKEEREIYTGHTGIGGWLGLQLHVIQK